MRVTYEGSRVTLLAERDDDPGSTALVIRSLQAGNPLRPTILVGGPREWVETLMELLDGR